MDSMVQNFGGILRQDLIALMGNIATSLGFGQDHSDSTGSDTLSIDSGQSYELMAQNVGISFRRKTAQC